MPDLTTGKIAIVTGASSGFGAVTARKLVAAGHSVMLAARREERLKALADDLGGKAAYQVTDVTEAGQLQALADATVERFGRIDVLINNAGIMPLSLFDKGKIDEWDRMIDVNIKGVLYGIAACLPVFRKQKSGHVVNISSVAGHRVMPGSGVYSGTKFAVRAISEGLRQEAGPDLRVTNISPGAFSTELAETITDEDIRVNMGSRFMDIVQDPVHIANAILYAIEQPPEIDVNELIVRPTAQAQ
jgi:NADP-dependent 3-hydroxy acid dehydrogenase YdfG